jgi:hemolysin activation/secretion protein
MRKLKITIFVMILLSARPVYGQNLPSGVKSGAQAERYRKGVKEQKLKLEEKEVKAPQIEIEKEEKMKPPIAKGLSLTLKELTITGVTVFKPEELRPLYESTLNKQITFEELEAIAKKIEEKYAKKGFLTTTAYIPEQDVSGGKVEIRVIEGKLGALKIEQNKHFSSHLIEKYIHIKKNELLNINTLQRDLLRLNRNSDLEIRSVLEPGAEPGTSDIVLKVEEGYPHHLGFAADNQGTRLTGKVRGAAFLRSSNLTGRLDSLFFNSMFSSLSLGESLSYTLPIGTHGTLFGVDLVYFIDQIGKEYKSEDITGKSEIGVPYFSWELFLSENTQAYLTAGMEIKSLTKRVSGQSASSEQLRIPYFDFALSQDDSWGGGGQTFFKPSFAFSTEDFLGASSRDHASASRAGTGGFFFKYGQGLDRLQRMPFNTYLHIRTQIQTASHSLPSSEQIQLGGAYSVRGYPEGDYSADRGGYANVEWAFPFFRHIEPVLFYDVGGGNLKSVNSGEQRSKFLAGAGGGLRIRFRHAYLRLDWASHIGDEPAGGGGPSTFYFTFQSEY